MRQLPRCMYAVTCRWGILSVLHPKRSETAVLLRYVPTQRDWWEWRDSKLRSRWWPASSFDRGSCRQQTRVLFRWAARFRWCAFRISLLQSNFIIIREGQSYNFINRIQAGIYGLEMSKKVRSMQSSNDIRLLIHEVTPRVGILCFVPLLLAVRTVPFFRQIFLLQTYSMEPLSLAVGVLACHHFAEGRSAAIAVLIFGQIIVEIFLLVGQILLGSIHLHLPALEDLLFWPVFVLVLEFGQ